MTRKVNVVIAWLLLLLVAACASVPKVAFKPETKQSIKRIAIVETAEPINYFMDPGPSPGGSALYMFGALGGAILGGIESNRYETATARFNAAVAPFKPNLSIILLDQLEAGLKAKGYEVIRVPAQPKTADGKRYDFSKLEGQHDAVLVTILGAGYSVESGVVVPRVSVAASLYSRVDSEKLFSDDYVYGSRKFSTLIPVESDPKFTLPTMEAVYSNVGIAVDGLKTGTRKLTERLLTDL
jgi:hypothetical protein